MTVAELIKKLKTLDPKAKVVLSRDSEGNGYSPLFKAEAGFYAADSTWNGEFSIGPFAEHKSVPAVCLIPTN